MKYKILKPDPIITKKFVEELDLPLFIAKIFANRKFNNEHQVLDFLLTEEKLAEPFGLPDMEKVCERLTKAILNQEQITICGDYDVDGTLATTILLRFLRAAGAKVNFFIPHRTLDGYGISDETMKFLHESYQTKVAISVDTGTTAFDAAEAALKYGIDLLVTDHHNLSEKGLPPVYALINAKRLPDANNPYNILAGAGVAYFIIRGLNLYWEKNKILKKIDEGDYSVLAMMATIADVMPLHENNRIIVKYGLKKLPHCRIEGMNALFQELAIHTPVAKDIAFRFAPVINAAGRLGSAQQALELFIETNKLQAMAKAKGLIDLNNKRRKISESVNKEVLAAADKIVAEKNPPIIVVSGNFHVGVIGISAAKIVDKYNRPAMVIGLDETGYGKASCRSISGFNVKLALDYAKDYHLGGGGHDMAAGFSINKEQIPLFEDKVIEYFKTHPEIEEKEIDVEAEIDYQELDLEAIKYIEMMEPFGKDNPAPVVRIKNCKVSEQREIRGGGVMFTLENEVRALIFSASEQIKKSNIKEFDAIGEITAQKGQMRIIIHEIFIK
jgi:single-stranded-DNA-specific exonuclease